MLTGLPAPAKFYVRRIALEPRALTTLQVGLLVQPSRSNILYTLKNQSYDSSFPPIPWHEPIIAKKISLLRQPSLEKALPLIAAQIEPFWVRLMPMSQWKGDRWRIGYTLEAHGVDELVKAIRPLAHGEEANWEKRYGELMNAVNVRITSVKSIEESVKKVEELRREVQEEKGILRAVGLVVRALEDTNHDDLKSNPRVVMFSGIEGKRVRWQRLSEVEGQLEMQIPRDLKILVNVLPPASRSILLS